MFKKVIDEPRSFWIYINSEPVPLKLTLKKAKAMFRTLRSQLRHDHFLNRQDGGRLDLVDGETGEVLMTNSKFKLIY